jgi:hypothetical protein
MDWLEGNEPTEKEGEYERLREEYGFTKPKKGNRLYPLDSMETAAAEVNGVIISDFAQLPHVEITEDSRIRVLEGEFHFEQVENGKHHRYNLLQKAEVVVGPGRLPDYITGRVRAFSPMTIRNKLATLNGANLDVYLTDEKEDVLIYTLAGESHLSSRKDQRKAVISEMLKMNKKGDIKNPKKMKREEFLGIHSMLSKPYEVYNPFSNVEEESGGLNTQPGLKD